MTFFTCAKEDIWKNVFVHIMKVNGVLNNTGLLWLSLYRHKKRRFTKYCLFVWVPQKKKSSWFAI